MQAPAFASRFARSAQPDAVKAALGDHVAACDRARGRYFYLHCIGERLHDLFGRRVFTTVFGATVLMTLLAGCV